MYAGIEKIEKESEGEKLEKEGKKDRGHKSINTKYVVVISAWLVLSCNGTSLHVVQLLISFESTPMPMVHQCGPRTGVDYRNTSSSVLIRRLLYSSLRWDYTSSQ